MTLFWIDRCQKHQAMPRSPFSFLLITVYSSLPSSLFSADSIPSCSPVIPPGDVPSAPKAMKSHRFTSPCPSIGE